MTPNPQKPEPVEGYVPKVPPVFEMWDTPQMQRIEETALAHDTPKMCLLIQTLTMLSAEIHPRVTIADVGKGEGNLNMFAAIVGHSGSGKSSGSNVARDLIGREQSTPVNLSSGEGMLNSFRNRHEVKTGSFDENGRVGKMETQRMYIWRSRSCMMQVDEGSTLKNILKRQGVTIMGFMNTAWSGGALITTTANVDTNRHIPRNEYRFSGIVNVQDGLVDLLIGKDAANGTTQRFLFAKATFDADYEFPEPKNFHEPIKPLRFMNLPEDYWVNREEDDEAGQPIITFTDGTEPPEKRYTIAVYPALVKEITLRRRASMKDAATDPLDGHRAYSQLKVAALLALLHDRESILPEDWTRAEVVMRVSDGVRDFFEVTARAEMHAQAVNEGRRIATVAKSTEDTRTYNIAKSIARKVQAHSKVDCPDGCKTSCFKTCFNSKTRGFRDNAIDLALGQKWVKKVQGDGVTDDSKRTGDRYQVGEKKP